MTRNDQGSSLLMVICFTCAISVALLSVWRNSMYTMEAAQARTAYIQSLKSTEGLLNVGIELAIENYETMIASPQEISLELPGWFKQQGKEHSATLRVKGEKDYVSLRAQIANGNAVLGALRCNVTKEAEGGYKVWAWTHDKQS